MADAYFVGTASFFSFFVPVPGGSLVESEEWHLF